MKPETQRRIQELSRQHPSWTPSQLAIFLQGENQKVTSEDVRRTLARRPPSEPADEAEEERRANRYAAPREERRRSSLPVGILFGLILFVLTTIVPIFGSALGSAVQFAYLIVYFALLLITGAVGSRVRASGARAGMIAALVHVILTIAVVAVVFNALQPQLNANLPEGFPSVTGQQLMTGFIILIIVAIIVEIILGLIVGWAGATLFGRRKRRATFGS